MYRCIAIRSDEELAPAPDKAVPFIILFLPGELLDAAEVPVCGPGGRIFVLLVLGNSAGGRAQLVRRSRTSTNCCALYYCSTLL